MRLLVSVANAMDAVAAIAGGADIVDAKDPGRGALGAVAWPILTEIQSACAYAGAFMTAALGDPESPDEAERQAFTFARAGARMVKIGFASARGLDDVDRLLSAALAGAGAARTGCRVVAVAYADAGKPWAAAPANVLRAAIALRPAGVLVDTGDKEGPGLRSLFSSPQLGEWVRSAHDSGLVAAVAGKLALADVDWVLASGADIIGVRGAACGNGRTSAIEADRVRTLRMRCSTAFRPGPPPLEPAGGWRG